MKIWLQIDDLAAESSFKDEAIPAAAKTTTVSSSYGVCGTISPSGGWMRPTWLWNRGFRRDTLSNDVNVMQTECNCKFMTLGSISYKMDLINWPLPEDDAGRQRCRLGPVFMSENGLRIGNAVCVELPGGGEVLCRAMPRQDGAEGLICLSPAVCNKALTNLSAIKIVPSSHVTPVRTSAATSISVKVVLDDYTKVRTYQEAPERLACYVKNLMRYIFCAKDCVIDCSAWKIGKLYGIAFIIIEACSSEYVTVTNGTDVKVEHITCKERFMQERLPVTTPRIAGLDNQVEILKDVVMFPESHPNIGSNIRQFWQRGCLLCGPPGCGKTSLVRQICRDAGAYCMEVHCTDLTGSRPGESEEKMSKIFEKAMVIGNNGPTVLFLDEIDSVCPKRGSKLQDSRVSTHLLHLLDVASDSSCHLAVIGATNTPLSLDPAIRNPGRLEKQVFVGIPSEGQRLAVLRSLLNEVTLAPDVCLQSMAEATPGYVGADLASVVHHAYFLAVCEAKKENPSFTEVVLNGDHFRDALHVIRPSVQRGSDIFVDHKPVLWEEIGGLNDIKVQIQQAVEWPLKHPEAFSRLGIRAPRGVLLYGPPGCAKTTLVKAAATSCHVTFLSISGGQLFSPFVGDSERKLSEAFQKARAGAPSILFIDELDSLVGSRSLDSQKSGAQERVLSTLLNEMDGIGIKLNEIQKDSDAGSGTAYKPAGDFKHEEKSSMSHLKDNKDVLVVAATNRPDRIDKALLRPGRIDRLIYVPPPDTEAREDIIRVHLRKMSHSNIDTGLLAQKTEGFTGADLENFCREAALHALSMDGLDVQEVTEKHFYDVLQNLRPSLTPEQLQQYAKIKIQSS